MSVILASFFILGLILGSFGGVIVTRLPQGRSIGGRSQCIHCEVILDAHNLVPVCSYILQQGKCGTCRKPLPWLYPFLELTSGLLFLGALFVVPFALGSALLLGVTLWLLLLIAVIDARTQMIPDALSIPFVVLSGITVFMVHGTVELSGAMFLGIFFALQWILSGGRWVGSGDVLLAVGIGLLLGGYQYALMCLFFAYVSGALVAIYLLMRKLVSRRDRIAFGPFLALGTVITIAIGSMLMTTLFVGI
jgi:prepilin signal peptidase PulO-like enzyme (type II secretory pathway)